MNLFGDYDSHHLAESARKGWRRARDHGPGHLRFWLIALVLGVLAAFAAVGFRLSITWLQTAIYGVDERNLATVLGRLPWYLIVSVPILGRLVTGLILHWFTPDGRARSVADAIEGAALHDGRVERRAGLASALASIMTLSTGGSAGREGPVVHLAGVISTWISDRLGADGITGRDLLGCAVAAAVSASFNAPIAGALFALEVVLRHFAVNAFAPIIIASVAGTVVSRVTFGDVTEFTLPNMGALAFYVELPAYLILGLCCGLVAAALMWGVFAADRIGSAVQNSLRLPRWLRPCGAGAVLGVLALWFPHIIGVGYETTSNALTGQLLFHEAVVFAVLKVIAVAVTMGGRMGGGIFSPSLMIGALTGLAFGIIATGLFPDVSGSQTLYALAGMGAVAAAVLGAPISTTLIVFELTGDWQTGLAVMVAVSTSTALASHLVDRSFFLTQLSRRGVKIAAGPQAYLMTMYRTGLVMRPSGDPRGADPDALTALAERGIALTAQATLEAAMAIFEAEDIAFIPVVDDADAAHPEVLGALFQTDVLSVFNRALASVAAEEHR